mmetsp:Transcript_33802/g.79124  ORF Transcript_33802/g.79124 Transcript_33802/m.79124 type:complete len:118 (-) Transcript_33802:69-422(-)
MSRQTRSHCANDACGQVRMWILLHVDVDHDFKINTTELTTLKYAHPDLDVSTLEARANRSNGVPIADVEPFLMAHFGAVKTPRNTTRRSLDLSPLGNDDGPRRNLEQSILVAGYTGA